MPLTPRHLAEPPLVLGIDIGSSSVRAIVFDARGNEVEQLSTQIAYAMTTTPDGGVEVDADELLALTASTVDGVLERTMQLGETIEGVGISCFWHSLTGVSESGNPLSPLYTWADTRSAKAADGLRRILDERAVHARTGAMLHPSYVPAKLAWLRQEQRALVDGVDTWMSFGEHLTHRWTSSTHSSVSMASGSGLFDQHRCVWDDELVETLEQPRLTPVAGVDSQFLALASQWRDRWPLLAEKPILAPFGDGACNNVGAGCTTPASFALTVGTSGAMRLVIEADDIQIPEGLFTYRLDRRRFVVGGALSEGGGVIAWMKRLLHLDDDGALDQEISSMEPDSHGLTVLPFAAGERSPGWSSHARATIDGLHLSTRPAEIVRAMMESIAYRFALIAEPLAKLGLDDASIVASGGALLHSRAWVQIMADVLGRPIQLSAEHEASCRGAALMMLEALGAIGDIASVPSRRGELFTPNAGRHERYRQAIERQRQLYAQRVPAARVKS